MNLDEPENKNAKTGHASARVYCIGPQYEVPTPVKHKNKISRTLSTIIYIVISVNTKVKKLFLSVPRKRKNLSTIFTSSPHL